MILKRLGICLGEHPHLLGGAGFHEDMNTVEKILYSGLLVSVRLLRKGRQLWKGVRYQLANATLQGGFFHPDPPLLIAPQVHGSDYAQSALLGAPTATGVNQPLDVVVPSEDRDTLQAATQKEPPILHLAMAAKKKVHYS